MNRIVGLETEYGCLAADLPGIPPVVQRVRDWVFQQAGLGLADLHQRDWDEPAGNGGFLYNGGRVYIDMGHLEYCTPECLSLIDVLRYDRAGDLLLNQAIEALGLTAHAGFIRNNIDHYSGATFGCHENYLVRRMAPFTERNIHSLLAMLTLRVLYTGAGRVGATKPAESRLNGAKQQLGGLFQISQRADYINNDLFEWVQFNRAIINTRDEPLADEHRFRRLHLLHGDTNVLGTALLLKVGTTALALDLLEIQALPEVRLSDPVVTFHELSRQSVGPWLVRGADGKSVDALELLLKYAEAARREFYGRDAETDFLISTWVDTILSLGGSPQDLIGHVDWVTKKWLFEEFISREGLCWSDPWLKSQDLEYHHINPERCLALPIEQSRWPLAGGDVGRAICEPPANTRAFARSKAMRGLDGLKLPYYLDWEVVGLGAGCNLLMQDPFDCEVTHVEAWLRRASEAMPSAQNLLFPRN